MSNLTRPDRRKIVVALAFLVIPLEPLLAQNMVARLCQQTDCNRSIIQLPRIDDSLFSSVTPGGSIFLKGRGLQNTIALTLKVFDFNGNPKEFAINLQQTGDTFIGASIRVGSVVGIKDQSALIQTRNSSNQFSNQFPVKFVAEREFRLLPADDPGIRTVACGYDSNYDVCNDWVDDDDDRPRYPGTGPRQFPIMASHTNCWACVGDDTGTDRYEVTLANGWIVDSFDFQQSIKPNKAEAWATAPALPTDRTGTWRPEIAWYATPNDTAYYNINIHIAGPLGVPF